MVGLLAGLLRLAAWRFILAAVILSEIFTIISISILSWMWWGHIPKDFLLVCALDAFLVALVVAPIILYFFRRAIHLQEVNQALQREAQERQRAAEEIQKREERYRLLFARAGDGIFILEGEGAQLGRILDANQAAIDNHGYSREELLSMKVQDLLSPGTPGPGQEIIDRIERGEWAQMEVMHRTKGGEDILLEASVGKYSYGGQNLLLAVERDITASRQAERALKESEAKFAKLFHNGPVWMSLSTVEDGRYLDANQAFLRGSGWSREELLGRTSLEIGLWDDPNQRAEGLRMLNQEGRIPEMRVKFRRKTGELLVGTWSAERIELGDTLCLVNVVTDETERYRAEEALRQSERRYRELVDSISDLICTHDLEGRLLTINQTACQAAGVPAKVLIGRNIQEFLQPQFREAFARDYLEAIKATGFHQGVTKLLDKDGRVRYLEYRNRLVQEPDKEPYVTGSARDVTERILAEREMRLLEGQLFQAQKIEALGVLAGGIAHDFNNVLQTISGYTQLVASQAETSPLTRERLGRVEESIGRAAGMIRQLMTLARKVEIRLEPVDLNREVDRTASILRHTLPRMIEIQTSLAEDLPPISGEPSQIEQVLLNLATNAGHAMPQGGLLKFETKPVVLEAKDCRTLPGLQPGKHVILTVVDTGTGMDEDVQSHIFEPFFTTKPLGEGTGLGLSTVYSIVANHGGHLGCQSAPGQGTTFTMYFPALNGSRDSRPAHQAQANRPEGLGGQETLLVVDDEKAILEACAEMLKSLGYSVLTAESGEKALDIFQRDPAAIDLVILDLNMTGMGGLKCLQQMRVLKPQAKVLVATGYAERGLEDQVLDLGGIGLLSKPYQFSKLLAVVRGALDQDRPSASPGELH